MKRRLEHRGQTPVGMHNHALRPHGQRAFAHLLDQYPEGLIGILERKQQRATLLRDDQRIHLAAAHLVQVRFGLRKPDAQVFVFSEELPLGCGLDRH